MTIVTTECWLQILAEDSVQADVYQAAVQPVVEDVMNGYNGTIMAYGIAQQYDLALSAVL